MSKPGCKVRLEMLEKFVKDNGEGLAAASDTAKMNNQIAIMNDMVRILEALERLEATINPVGHTSLESLG